MVAFHPNLTVVPMKVGPGGGVVNCDPAGTSIRTLSRSPLVVPLSETRSMPPGATVIPYGPSSLALRAGPSVVPARPSPAIVYTVLAPFAPVMISLITLLPESAAYTLPLPPGRKRSIWAACDDDTRSLFANFPDRELHGVGKILLVRERCFAK